MMHVHGGAVDVTTYFVLRSTTDGTELTAATITNLDLQYVRSGAAPAAKVDATALAATDSAHADNKAIEIDATDQPGLYRVDWPDAAFAAGVKEVILSVKYTGAFTEHLRVMIDPPVNVEMWNATNVATPTVAGVPEVDATHLLGTAWTAPATAGLPDCNVKQISTDATAADNAEAFFDGTGYAGTNNVIPTVTTLTNLPAITANWLTAAGTAADFGAEIADAVWDEDATGHQTGGTFGQAIGDPGADTTTIYQSVVTDAAGTNIAVDIAAIEAQTDDIGVAGAGLTAIPWNASWDAEVQSEVDDALVAQRLDELLNADSDIDGAAPPTVGSVFHELMIATAGSFTFEQTTDSCEAIRNRGDAAWITATGFSTHSAADVWAAGTRTLTAATNITSTGGTTVPQTGDSYAIVNSGTHGNAALKTLIDDVPTNAELATSQGTADDATLAAIAALSIPTTAQIATAVLTTQMTEAYAANGVAPTLAQAMFALHGYLMTFAISATSYTVKKLDGSTTAFIVTLNDATSPTAATRS